MILVRRTAAPKELLSRQGEWTSRFQQKSIGADWAPAAAKKLLQEHLRNKSHNKCVYCESVLGGSAWHEVEHYHAKTVRPDLVFEWTNLFLACGVCNGRKGNEVHNGTLLKPDEDDGELFFWLNRDTGQLEALPGADAARVEASIRICDLNRETLSVQRLRMFRSVQRHWRELEQGKLPQSLVPEFAEFLKPRTEHKFAIRSALPRELANIDRRMFHHAG